VANERFESIWDAIEDDPVERERMKVLSQLMMTLDRHIKKQGWTQAEAAKQLGVTQPRISDLMRGKINLFSIDSLFELLAKAGIHMELRVRDAA
jgi:predicted XRE-type DNA-binding protein